MTPDRWARITEIFLAALEKAPGEREAFLTESCPDDALRQEVWKLLEAHEGTSLASPVPRMLAATPRPAVIGRYRIVRLLGEGGMGAVYEAEQDQPRRTVALKVIKTAFASSEMRRRFEHECEALGRLQHPGIAQIHEAGTAESEFGPQPYFAMELIRGESLLRFAEMHSLSTRQRLALMAKVCEAVHHAHQRGIIHRDLKPGNIFVDETGQPKILDFGVARATDADARATRQTDLGQLIGTLAYMSPEQVLGDPLELDTRSDVYALGVILFELMAGRLPYEIGAQVPKAIRTIREQDPARLSAVSRIFRGDIETIAAKALEKDKMRRYSSAAEMAEDIQRYLKDEPIVARPSTATYHIRKFARRHSALVTAAAVTFLVLIAGVITSTLEAARARRAELEAFRQRDAATGAQEAAQKEREAARKVRDRAVSAEQVAIAERDRSVAEQNRADTEAATAKAVSDFLRNDLLSQASPWQQSRPGVVPDAGLTVRAALDRAAARMEGRFSGQPVVEAAIRHTVGDAYASLGLYPEADRHFARVLELRRRALGPAHQDTLATTVAIAEVRMFQGRYAEAEALLREALNAQRRTLGEENENTLYTRMALAELLKVQGKFSLAQQMQASNLRILRRTKGEDDLRTLTSLGHLAIAYLYGGKSADAEPLLIQAVQEQRRVLGEEHPETLLSMHELGMLYSYTARYAEAQSLWTKVLEARRRMLGPDHLNTLAVMVNLADLYRIRGDSASAEAMYTKALQRLRRTFGEEHPYTIGTMANLAVFYQSQDKDALAEALLTKVLEVRRRLLGPEHPDTLVSLRNLGGLYRKQGRYVEADPLLAQAVESGRRVLGVEHPFFKSYLIALGRLRMDEHRDAEAESILREALTEPGAQNVSTWNPDETRSLLGASLAAQGKYAEAEPLLLGGYRALAERGAAPGKERLVREAAERLVQLYSSWDKPGQAAEWRSRMQSSAPASPAAKR
jgi:tetratricopeptide (TPR) repeat protein